MDKMEIWGKLSKTPQEARKPIEAGRLKGFTDINPMWRFKALTELFGACGIGWRYQIDNCWIESGGKDEKKCFVQISLFYKDGEKWSEAVPGFGGSSFVSQERGGPYVNDECFKMALSDAIGTACKALGMSADIFFERDRTKYTTQASGAPKCERCGKEIKKVTFPSGTTYTPEEFAEETRKRYGQCCCYECYGKAKADARIKGM